MNPPDPEPPRLQPLPLPRAQTAQARSYAASASNSAQSGNGTSAGRGTVIAAGVAGVLGIVAFSAIFAPSEQPQQSAPVQKEKVSDADRFTRHDAWYALTGKQLPITTVAPDQVETAIKAMNFGPEAAALLRADIAADRAEIGVFTTWDPDGDWGASVKFELGSQISVVPISSQPKPVYVVKPKPGPAPLKVTMLNAKSSVGMKFLEGPVVTDYAWGAGREFTIMVR
jgi:hypothetical protein